MSRACMQVASKRRRPPRTRHTSGFRSPTRAQLGENRWATFSSGTGRAERGPALLAPLDDAEDGRIKRGRERHCYAQRPCRS
jgi:hypothetical protein